VFGTAGLLEGRNLARARAGGLRTCDNPHVLPRNRPMRILKERDTPTGTVGKRPWMLPSAPPTSPATAQYASCRYACALLACRWRQRGRLSMEPFIGIMPGRRHSDLISSQMGDAGFGKMEQLYPQGPRHPHAGRPWADPILVGPFGVYLS